MSQSLKPRSPAMLGRVASMKTKMKETIREAVILTLACSAIAIVFNSARKDGIALIASPDDFRVRTKAEFIRPLDALRFHEEGKAIFVDARSAESFAKIRIEGALNITPTDDINAFSWLTQMDSYIICYAGQDTQRQAGVVADRLIDFGCKNVFVLYGGIEEWIKGSYPIEQG